MQRNYRRRCFVFRFLWNQDLKRRLLNRAGLFSAQVCSRVLLFCLFNTLISLRSLPRVRVRKSNGSLYVRSAACL